jgi:hypothetical protein
MDYRAYGFTFFFHLVNECYDSRDAVSWIVTYTWAGEVAACAPLPTR